MVFSQEPGTQQLYDIPPSPQKAALGPPASQTNVSMIGTEIWDCANLNRLWEMLFAWSKLGTQIPHSRIYFTGGKTFNCDSVQEPDKSCGLDKPFDFRTPPFLFTNLLWELT